MLFFRSFLSAHMTTRSCSASRHTAIHASVTTCVKVAVTAVKRRTTVASIGVRTTSVTASCVKRPVVGGIAFFCATTAYTAIVAIAVAAIGGAVVSCSAVVTSVARRGVAVVVGALVICFRPVLGRFVASTMIVSVIG